MLSIDPTEISLVVARVAKDGAIAAEHPDTVHVGDRLTHVDGKWIDTTFSTLDAQSDGVMWRDEVCNAFRRIGSPISPSEADEIMQQYDTDDEGGLSKKEFEVLARDRFLTLAIDLIATEMRPLTLRFRSRNTGERAHIAAERQAARVQRKTERDVRREKRAQRIARNMHTWQDCNEAASLIQGIYRRWMTRRAISRLKKFNAWKKLEPLMIAMRALLWIILAAYTAFMMYLCLIYGLKFGPELAKGWLIASTIACATDFFIAQPMKAVQDLAKETLVAALKTHTWVPQFHCQRTCIRTHDALFAPCQFKFAGDDDEEEGGARGGGDGRYDGADEASQGQSLQATRHKHHHHHHHHKSKQNLFAG